VLFYLMTERPDRFEEIQSILGHALLDFKRLSVKARGAPGEVIAFYEQRDGTELTIADLSDGTIRLLCWATLCHRPRRGVTCIDEPDQGFHPRVLPIIADMFRKAALTRQCLIATHSSYFLRQFDVSEIAVIRNESGEPKWVKPADSKILKESLEDFGEAEIERMHRSEELEQLA
jgi:predicted ATPase